MSLNTVSPCKSSSQCRNQIDLTWLNNSSISAMSSLFSLNDWSLTSFVTQLALISKTWISPYLCLSSHVFVMYYFKVFNFTRESVLHKVIIEVDVMDISTNSQLEATCQPPSIEQFRHNFVMILFIEVEGIVANSVSSFWILINFYAIEYIRICTC